jgi:hypothetical protein
MTTSAQVAALSGVVATAVIYGTDVFCALVLRPAAAGASDASVADLLGRVHHYGDRRLPAPGVVAIAAAAVATAVSDQGLGRLGAGLALVALLAWLAIYLGVSAPINRRLRAAAASGEVPADTRILQDRWDAVIWPRAALQTTALAGLLLATLTA